MQDSSGYRGRNDIHRLPPAAEFHNGAPPVGPSGNVSWNRTHPHPAPARHSGVPVVPQELAPQHRHKKGTVVCRHWKRGRCDLKDACNFAHHEDAHDPQKANQNRYSSFHRSPPSHCPETHGSPPAPGYGSPASSMPSATGQLYLTDHYSSRHASGSRRGSHTRNGSLVNRGVNYGYSNYPAYDPRADYPIPPMDRDTEGRVSVPPMSAPHRGHRDARTNARHSSRSRGGSLANGEWIQDYAHPHPSSSHPGSLAPSFPASYHPSSHTRAHLPTSPYMEASGYIEYDHMDDLYSYHEHKVPLLPLSPRAEPNDPLTWLNSPPSARSFRPADHSDRGILSHESDQDHETDQHHEEGEEITNETEPRTVGL